MGRVQGYQTAFFLVQGAAVAATIRVKPRGRHAAPWIAATFAFNVVGSVPFFASLDEAVPFYQHRPPLRDGGWRCKRPSNAAGPRGAKCVRQCRRFPEERSLSGGGSSPWTRA